MLHPFDYHDRLYKMVVQSRGTRERYGTMSFSGKWRWSDAPALDLELRGTEARGE
jgi:hypothetical protein